MKYILFSTLAVVFIFTSSIIVSANENDFYTESINDILEQTPEESKKILEQLGLSDCTFDELNNISLDDIWELLISIFKGSLNKPFKLLLLLVEISIISSVCSAYLSNSKTQLLFDSITVVIIALIVFSNIKECIIRASASLVSICTLMKVLIPTITAIASFSGNPALAVSYNAITVYTSEIIGTVCTDFLSPILINFAMLSVCLTFNSFVKGENILTVIKKAVNMILGFCASVFTGIAGIKNLLSSGADKISVKGIQFLLGSSVPVVGGALSDGLSSVLATVSLLKSTVGAIGVILTIVTVLPTICELVLWTFSLSSASYICGILSLSKAESILLSLKFVITILISIILFCTYIFIISTGMVILMGSN